MILFVKIIESVSGLLCVPYQESKKIKEKNKTSDHFFFGICRSLFFYSCFIAAIHGSKFSDLILNRTIS